MKQYGELIVSLLKQPDDIVWGFDRSYARCCAWIQYGSPITSEGMKILKDTKDWNIRDSDLFQKAVERIGIPEGMWVKQQLQNPIKKLKGVYNLYTTDKLGIVLAIMRLKIKPTFPPRKDLELCESYIFNPLKGLYYVCTRGQSKFDSIVIQEIVDIATEVLAPRDNSLLKELCWADITKHVMFTIKDNGGGKSTNFR